MEITDIKIRLINDERLVAYVTLTFDDVFVVHNMKIVEGEKGLFLAMPNRQTHSGEFKDIAHPIQTSYRKYLQDRVLEEYKVLKEEK